MPDHLRRRFPEIQLKERDLQVFGSARGRARGIRDEIGQISLSARRGPLRAAQESDRRILHNRQRGDRRVRQLRGGLQEVAERHRHDRPGRMPPIRHQDEQQGKQPAQIRRGIRSRDDRDPDRKFSDFGLRPPELDRQRQSDFDQLQIPILPLRRIQQFTGDRISESGSSEGRDRRLQP